MSAVTRPSTTKSGRPVASATVRLRESIIALQDVYDVMTVRQIFYSLVSRGVVPKDENRGYRVVQRQVLEMRVSGLRCQRVPSAMNPLVQAAAEAANDAGRHGTVDDRRDLQPHLDPLVLRPPEVAPIGARQRRPGRLEHAAPLRAAGARPARAARREPGAGGVSNGKVDYSLMTCYIDDAAKAIGAWEAADDAVTAPELLLLAIASSLQAIAVALTANHMGDEYP